MPISAVIGKSNQWEMNVTSTNQQSETSSCISNQRHEFVKLAWSIQITWILLLGALPDVLSLLLFLYLNDKVSGRFSGIKAIVVVSWPSCCIVQLSSFFFFVGLQHYGASRCSYKLCRLCGVWTLWRNQDRRLQGNNNNNNKYFIVIIVLRYNV